MIDISYYYYSHIFSCIWGCIAMVLAGHSIRNNIAQVQSSAQRKFEDYHNAIIACLYVLLLSLAKSANLSEKFTGAVFLISISIALQ